MPYSAGGAYYKEFVTTSPTLGTAVNADSLPAATANKNGTDDGAFVLTVANTDTGRYKITGTIPGGYVTGDVLSVSVAATVSGVSGKGIVDTQIIETSQTGDTFTRLGVNGVGLSAIPDLAGVTTLLARLTAARAGYLDNVNNATLAAAAFPTDPADQSLLIVATDAIGAATAALSTLLTSTGVVLTADERNAIADAAFARSLGTESYAADGSVPTLAQMQFMILSIISQFSIIATALTTKKLDGTTPAMVYTLDNAANPTSRVRSS